MASDQSGPPAIAVDEEDTSTESVEWEDVFWKLCSDPEKSRLSGTEAPNTQVTWSEIEWDQRRGETAARLLAMQNPADKFLPAEQAEEHQRDAPQYWDRFYSHFEAKFFKDRTYLLNGFPELLGEQTPGVVPSEPQRLRILEAGCGVGNTLIPLMKSLPQCTFFGCDFSPAAIRVLQKNPQLDTNRCTTFVCDLTEPTPLLNAIPANSLDFILIIFTLSAIPPQKLPVVLNALKQVLRPGGSVLIRDYGLYDLAQLRFFSKKNRQIGENMYVRGDDFLERCFSDSGFQKNRLKYDTRKLLNRKRKISMYRVTVQGRFLKPV